MPESIHQQVGVKIAHDLLFIPNLYGHFVFNFVSGIFQFVAQCFVVDRFQETKPEFPVHLHRRTNDFAAKIVT
jgi:hypothetical protein